MMYSAADSTQPYDPWLQKDLQTTCDERTKGFSRRDDPCATVRCNRSVTTMRRTLLSLAGVAFLWIDPGLHQVVGALLHALYVL